MNLPQEFLNEIEGYGFGPLNGIGAALQTPPSVSVRFNAGKGLLTAPGADAVPWCGAGCYLDERPAFTFDPLLHQGGYYVQDASSMFITHVLRQITAGGAPVRYLDACAAPGGKTTAAIDSLPEGSVVVANEFVPSRAAILRENLVKWGYPLCCVTQGDTGRFAADGAVFDIIAADVPCSGEGMMRKDEEAVRQWSGALVQRCAERQREIVDNLWHALLPGGYFIYSTCTFNRVENEEMVEYMMRAYGAESVEIDGADGWGIAGGIDTGAHCCRFIPGQVRGEGLFMAVLRKPVTDGAGVGGNGKRARKKERVTASVCKAPKDVRGWLDYAFDGDVVMRGDSVFACPAIAWTDFPYRPEVEVGTVKGKDVIPSHTLAMSRLLNTGAFSRVEVDYATAISYLRCEAVSLDAGAPRGVVLLTYGGIPLGFAKNLGNRANNLYPKQWRILSQHGGGEVGDAVAKFAVRR